MRSALLLEQRRFFLSILNFAQSLCCPAPIMMTPPPAEWKTHHNRRATTEAAAVLASEEAVDHVGKLRQLAGGALPPVKGGNAALAEAIHAWFCAASCVKGKGFVGQVAAPCVWRRALTRTDVMFVANGALLGNETGLVACLDMASYADKDRVVPDRFSEDLHGTVVSEGTVGAEVLLRAGVEWLPSLPPGSTPKLEGDLCALHLGSGAVCVCVCLCMYVCMYACMYVCMHVCMHASMHVCMHTCMYVCMHTCVCVYRYM